MKRAGGPPPVSFFDVQCIAHGRDQLLLIMDFIDSSWRGWSDLRMPCKLSLEPIPDLDLGEGLVLVDWGDWNWNWSFTKHTPTQHPRNLPPPFLVLSSLLPLSLPLPPSSHSFHSSIPYLILLPHFLILFSFFSPPRQLTGRLQLASELLSRVWSYHHHHPRPDAHVTSGLATYTATITSSCKQPQPELQASRIFVHSLLIINKCCDWHM
ncbi:hypothetical protein EJ05DRAFT_96277 [Pseudovirgaria hyperparasitica]|uniref:Uncharacterized protein n=1 Tax=Pseudovirgaria hyperparasitica TaxID=470096 RepID=A0A6A6W2N2_9PEZI|nr:uncharacterized protein EJ05DRAFT_96277 [Pseudovirgaria hyperparasitica]KAF2756286.1 hypothetical protein EJ05DRAFT_96277 [Pseudovirgaria hyperparasitica]